MELIRIWEVIRRRRWIILQALILITLVAFVGSYFITPCYEASAKILIKRAEKTSVNAGSIGLSSISSIITASPDVDVNRVLATSGPVIEKMASKLQLRDTKGNLIQAKRLTGAGMVPTIKRKILPEPCITIGRFQTTDILLITAKSPNPEEAMMMADTLAETMVSENLIQMRAEYKSARIFLEDQIQKVRERYTTALLRLTEFRKTEKTVDLATETKLATEKMAELLKQKEDNIIDLAEARAKLTLLKEQLRQQDFDFLPASALQENPQIEILKKRLMDLKIKLSEATSELRDKHPKVVSLREQVKTTEAELKREIDTYRASAPGLATLESQIAALETHLRGVNADIDKYFESLGGLPDKAFMQANIDMELNFSQRVYTTLLDYLYQVGIAEAATISEIRVIDPAVRPLYPVSPNKILNGILGLFLGLVFGVGLAFLFEYVDDTIRTAEDLKGFKDVALIGMIPKVTRKTLTLISESDSKDPLSESYRTIRTYLKFIGKSPLKVLLITCPGPEEGKSTTAVNLGISISHEGKRVAIVDMDLHRPAIHTYLKVSNAVGVVDILKGATTMDNAVQSTRIRGLSAVTSGPPPSNPGSLIESDLMASFISSARDRFDLVIMDTPPMLVMSDALILARYADGLIILIESGKTTRHALTELMETLANANLQPLGFILNKVPIGEGRYNYYQYYYGERYLPEKTTKSRKDGRKS